MEHNDPEKKSESGGADEKDHSAESDLAEQRQNFESKASKQEQEITALTVGLRKVNERMESRASATDVAANN